MSQVSPDSPRGKARPELPDRPAVNSSTRPGWLEIAALVGLAVMFAVVAVGLLSIIHLGLGPVLYGLLLR